MRSKNHLLYELYLEELDAPEIFSKTERYSLSHIVTFVEKYDQLRDGQSAQEILKIIADKEIESIEEMEDKDFNMYSTVKHLYRSLSSADVDVLAEVIHKIDQYHESKRS